MESSEGEDDDTEEPEPEPRYESTRDFKSERDEAR